MGLTRPRLSFISVFLNKLQFFTVYVKYVHPASGARIQTHDLLDVSLLP